MPPDGVRIRCAVEEASSAWLIRSMRLDRSACICRATTLAAPAPSAKVASTTAAGRNSQAASETWNRISPVAVTAPNENATERAPNARIHPATPPATASSADAAARACALAGDGARDAALRFAPSPP